MSQTGFAELPKEFTEYNNSRVVLLPVEFDATSTWIKGADKGPEALIAASDALELYDIETDSEPGFQGMFVDEAIGGDISPEKMVELVRERVSKHLDSGKFVCTLGGEHSVSIGAIEAHCEKFKDVTVLQLDAHADLRDEYHGSKYNHACVMARARDVASIIQVGIRSVEADERKYIEPDRIFYAENIYNSEEWIDQLVSKLTENVYITIDLDVFDPSIMPSTGTPEPGGLGWYPVLKLLRKVIGAKKLIGYDIVELCPDEVNKHSDLLAAKLLYKILAYEMNTNR